MKTLHLVFLTIFIVLIIVSTKPVYAESDLIKILNVQVQPSTIRVNNTFSISTTVLNTSPYPVYLTSGSCVPAFSIEFDSNAKQLYPDIACTMELLIQKVNPQEQVTISNINKPGTIYKATQVGISNANLTIRYFAKNQTSKDYSNIDYTISKPFQFQIFQSNETKMWNQFSNIPIKPDMDLPLKQFKSGINAVDVKCKSNFLLVLKSEDNHPACTKPQTALYLSKIGWGEISGSEIQTDLLDSKITDGKIIGFQYDIRSKSIIVEIQASGNGSLIVTIPRQLIDAKMSGHDDRFYVLSNGMESNFKETDITNISRTLMIPFKTDISQIEILANSVGQQAP